MRAVDADDVKILTERMDGVEFCGRSLNVRVEMEKRKKSGMAREKGRFKQTYSMTNKKREETTEKKRPSNGKGDEKGGGRMRRGIEEDRGICRTSNNASPHTDKTPTTTSTASALRQIIHFFVQSHQHSPTTVIENRS